MSRTTGEEGTGDDDGVPKGRAHGLRHQVSLRVATKCRSQVLRGKIAERTRDSIRQVCIAKEITILEEHASVDHVHLYVPATPHLSPARVMHSVRGNSSWKIVESPIEVRRPLPECLVDQGQNRLQWMVGTQPFLQRHVAEHRLLRMAHSSPVGHPPRSSISGGKHKGDRPFRTMKPVQSQGALSGDLLTGSS